MRVGVPCCNADCWAVLQIDRLLNCRERQALARANRKVDKKMREMLLQVEEERRHADQYKEQVRASAAMAGSAANSRL